MNDIHTGDCIDVMNDLPESSVHMAMCSPPYYGLRDYGVDGQIGLEESLSDYIQNLVDVGDALRRVLRDDGSWWLNLGDSYSGGNASFSDSAVDSSREEVGEFKAHVDRPGIDRDTGGLGRKNKMLVPHRVAIALQDAGWVVRNDCVWYKPNPMPSSVKDRLNTCFEFVFHLTPNPDYWYDLDAVREPHTARSLERMQEGPVNANIDGRGTNDCLRPEQLCDPAGKNPGDVFEITTKPFPDAHFAVYPPELCETPIKASCPPKVCAECGMGYERDVEHDKIERSRKNPRTTPESQTNRPSPNDYAGVSVNHKGWLKPCDCDTDATEAGIALDPFAGAGTTCLVAKRLGRRFIGIELNPEYADMARARCGLAPNDPSRLREETQGGLEVYGGDARDE